MNSEILKYARGLGAKQNVIDWINTLVGNDQAEVEHIIDFLIFKDFTSLKWASYNLLLEKTKKWTRQLTQNVSTIDEEYGIDIETVLDFEDGFRIVKLISEKAYTREGALMSQCVSSYYARDVEVYSLRDSFNKPHCTIEKDVQIKGKGNGKINQKYIDYIVEFLEWTGMDVRDSEMENLGFVVAKFPDYIKNSLYRGKYARSDEEIEYKEDVIVFTCLEEAINYKGNKTCLYDGDATFYLGIESLGNLESISGYADFRDSKVKSLGSLKSIGGSAYFGGSEVKSLGSLKLIGGSADFRNSEVESLGSLKSIGDNALFSNSKVESLGSLKSIGGSADFRNSEVESLGSLKSIGDNALFSNSKVESLSNLESIKGSLDLENSKIKSLGNLKSVGVFIHIRGVNIKSLKNLKPLFGDRLLSSKNGFIRTTEELEAK